MLLKRGDFAAFVANWTDKATNLRAIAEALNLGLDALVFVDDNPVERAQVRAALPEVAVPELPPDPAHYVRTPGRGRLLRGGGLHRRRPRPRRAVRGQPRAREPRGRGLRATWTTSSARSP